MTVGFSLVIICLVAFGGWAWTAQAHAVDVDAFEAMKQQLVVMDRSVTPQRHGAFAPCREGIDGTVTRTYPLSQPPTVLEVVAYLAKQGWSEVAPTPPAVATMMSNAAGPDQTIEVFGLERFGAARSLTATSPGSRVGCFLR